MSYTVLPSFSVATYNIELSKKYEQIVKNVHMLASQGVAVFCFQEILPGKKDEFIVKRILTKLGSDWDTVYFFGDEQNYKALGVAIIWNKRILQLTAVQQLLLPQLDKLAFHEAIGARAYGFDSDPITRRAITATFQLGKASFRVSSVHIDICGGVKQKQRQIAYLLSFLQHGPHADYEIIAGDFNTTAFLKIQHQKKKITDMFLRHGYADATSTIPWTQDLHYSSFGREDLPLRKFLLRFDLHMRQKLDYIWTKNLSVTKAERMEMHGSDHFPVVAQLDFQQ